MSKSNLVTHAETELKLIGADKTMYGDMVYNAALEIVEKFASQGHSGMSASIVTDLVTKLMKFEPLSPLTGNDDEWNEFIDGEFQNKRCSHVFKEGKNGQAFDIQGKIFREPSGSCFTNSESRVPVTFPYVPTREYVDVQV